MEIKRKKGVDRIRIVDHNKPLLMIIIILIVVVIGILIYSYMLSRQVEPIGGDKDEHGCYLAAGYNWCEFKGKCVRLWEEGCYEPGYQTLEEYYNAMNYSCEIDEDCIVKDTRNCCGPYPECVNRFANIDSEFVEKACIEEEAVSICGFFEIAECKCLNNRCETIVSVSQG